MIVLSSMCAVWQCENLVLFWFVYMIYACKKINFVKLKYIRKL